MPADQATASTLAMDLLLRLTGKNFMRLYAVAFASCSTTTTILPWLMMAELVDELDQTLFTAVLHNDDHVLR